MSAYNLSPIALGQFSDQNGIPLSGGFLTVYFANTNTLATTYTSPTGSVANPNPFTLDSRGSLGNTEIWLASGIGYKFVLTNSVGVAQNTWDNVQGINDTSGASTTNWVIGGTPTYISATQFSLTGDQTLLFAVNRRCWAIVSNINIYGTITASVFSAGITTVTVLWDNTTLSAGLSAVYYANTPVTVAPVPANLLYVSGARGWTDVLRAGWRPWNVNQYWGGGWNLRPDGQVGDTCSGSIDDVTQTGQPVADAAGDTYVAQGFKVGEALSIAAVWIKIFKTGAPTANLTAYIFPDDGSGTKPTGSSPITNGTSTAQAGTAHTASPDGAWVRFVFPNTPGISANTFYHVVLKSSAAVSASNFWNWRGTTARRYPFGNLSVATAAPVWTATTTSSSCFLIEPTSATQWFQSGGVYNDGQLRFAAGLPTALGKALVQPLSNFFSSKEFTLYFAVSGLALNTPLADFIWGIDHNRIRVSITGSGYAQVDVWGDQVSSGKAGAQVTLAATSVNLSSGNHVVGVHVRAFGDGSDRVDVFVDGVTYSLTAQTISFSPLMRQLGTAWLGGSLGTVISWTQKLDMSALPSTLSWTFTGTGTEGNIFTTQSISGVNKVLQDEAGLASATGYYVRSALSLSNATGWAVQWKAALTGAAGGYYASGYEPRTAVLKVEDGSYVAELLNNPWWSSLGTGAAILMNTQHEPTLVESEYVVTGKGADEFVFLNGALHLDGSSLLTTATANNRITWGCQNQTWVQTTATTFVSGTTFSCTGNQNGVIIPGHRIKVIDNGLTLYGFVINLAGSGPTNVVVRLDDLTQLQGPTTAAYFSYGSGRAASVQHDCLAYLNTGSIAPSFTTGFLSEFAFWPGNQTAAWSSMYNGGSLVSAQSITASKPPSPDNSQTITTRAIQTQPIASNSVPTTDSCSLIAKDAFAYTIGSSIQARFKMSVEAGLVAANYPFTDTDWVIVDGVSRKEGAGIGSALTSASTVPMSITVIADAVVKGPLGLHYSQGYRYTQFPSFSAYILSRYRSLTVTSGV
jgi:hypothetical protein